jgi:peptide/nickel transport system substrate-binding protein
MPRTRTTSRPAARRGLVLTATALLSIGTVATTASATTVPEGDPDAAVVAGFVIEPTNLDIINQAGAALDQLLLGNIYETLVKSSPDGEISPGLADLEISEDRLTYTLTVHDGVTFHDGDPLTASDVVWTLEQQRAAFEAPRLAAVESVEAPDDATVVITLAEPDNDLAFHLSQRAGAVLNEGATGLENTANGTGPFVFDEWNQGSSITLVRNEEYWGEPASISEITFQYFTDPNAAANALLDGDIDLHVRIDTDLVEQFEDNPDFVITDGPTNGEFTLGMNNADEVLSDQRVRQAITQAIDKQGLIDLYRGYATLIGAPVPPFEPWYEDLSGVYPYDPDAARALLEEAGYADGLDLTFVAPNIYPTYALDYVVSQLADVGITVTLETVEFPTWIDQVFVNHDYDLTVVLHVEPRDIDNYANPEYYWLYDSAEVQDLLAQARATPDPEQFVELRRQAARLIAEEAPAVWLLLYNDVTVARTGVSGYPTFDANARFDAFDITVEA